MRIVSTDGVQRCAYDMVNKDRSCQFIRLNEPKHFANSLCQLSSVGLRVVYGWSAVDLISLFRAVVNAYSART
jgi:hypothetical protein